MATADLLPNESHAAANFILVTHLQKLSNTTLKALWQKYFSPD